MPFLLMSLPTLSLTVLGAHFYRSGHWPVVALCGVLLVLLWTQKRPWAARLLQWSLLLGALEWLRTVFVLVQMRLAMDLPWQRLALILLAVSVVTAASALVFRHPRLRLRFAPV
ncbi:MAG: hypothetical protein JNK55_22255 [Rubrivivax sp.]|nr:hypothetical protein [Rubrivivax sp.]